MQCGYSCSDSQVGLDDGGFNGLGVWSVVRNRQKLGEIAFYESGQFREVESARGSDPRTLDLSISPRLSYQL